MKKTVVPQKQPYGFTSDITLKKYQLNAISWMKSVEEDVGITNTNNLLYFLNIHLYIIYVHNYKLNLIGKILREKRYWIRLF